MSYLGVLVFCLALHPSRNSRRAFSEVIVARRSFNARIASWPKRPGLSAQRWDHLGAVVTIPSFCGERIDLYLERELGDVSGTPDEDEVIRVEKISFDDAMKMIRSGEIVDAKTIAAFYRAHDVLEG